MYQAKKNLKGTKIMIVESLTKRRLELLKRAKETFGATNVWTSGQQTFGHRGNKRLDIGKKTLHGKPRPIIVKLCNYHDKEKMYQAKKNLKGTKIMIVESLTKRRLELLKRAKETFGATNVWTSGQQTFGHWKEDITWKATPNHS